MAINNMPQQSSVLNRQLNFTRGRRENPQRPRPYQIPQRRYRLDGFTVHRNAQVSSTRFDLQTLYPEKLDIADRINQTQGDLEG